MPNKVYISIILIAVLAAVSAFAKGKKSYFDNIRVEKDHLCADYHQEGLIDKELLNGLRKGLTAAIEYEIRLWDDNPGWVKKVVVEKRLRMKVGWDNWEHRYVVIRREEEPDFLTEDAIIARCEDLVNIQICPMDQLDQDTRYRIEVRIILEPLSVENVEEIKKWLAGEAKDLSTESIRATRSPLKKAGDWLLGAIVNITGFGERMFSDTSTPFVFHQNTIQLLENP